MLLRSYIITTVTKLVIVTSFVISAGGHATSQVEGENSLEFDFFKVVNIRINDVLNIRQTPNPQGIRLGNIPYNKCVTSYTNKSSLYNSQKWVKVTYNGIEGWVNSSYLRQEPDCAMHSWKVVNVQQNDVLNMRQAPHPHSTKIGEIPPTTACFPKLDEAPAPNQKKWFLVQYNDVAGWVNSYYLELCP